MVNCEVEVSVVHFKITARPALSSGFSEKISRESEAS
jgi:hypothetical protein